MSRMQGVATGFVKEVDTSLARVRVFLLAGTYARGYSEEAPPLAGLALVDQ